MESHLLQSILITAGDVVGGALLGAIIIWTWLRRGEQTAPEEYARGYWDGRRDAGGNP